MAKFINREAKKVGTAPGSLIFVGTRRMENARVEIYRYSENEIEHFNDVDLRELSRYEKSGMTLWINFIGLHDIEKIQQIGESFNIHPLILEDILNTDQRAKLEEIEHHMAFFTKMVRCHPETQELIEEQLSMVLGKDLLLTFQEAEGDVFDSVRDRLNRATTKIRLRGADYLAFALLDAVVDHYIVTIETVGDKVEASTEKLHEGDEENLGSLNYNKREINRLRRIVRPMIEVSNLFEKSESPLVQKKTIPFIKDLEDHVLQAGEAIEIYKELINDELGIYHANMSAKLNDIIRVLTIFSVVFIPLTFLAGIYGTNFHYLPELEYKYAYPIFWMVLILVALIMLFFFKRRKWL